MYVKFSCYCWRSLNCNLEVMDHLVESLLSLGRGKGEGGVLKKGLYGKAPPRGPAPYHFVYHLIMTEKVPLSHT